VAAHDLYHAGQIQLLKRLGARSGHGGLLSNTALQRTSDGRTKGKKRDIDRAARR
jgi:hypothetical protein